MDVIPSSADAGSGRLLKNCPHCRLRVRLSQRERMGEEGYVALLCNCTQGRFLLPGGEGEDEGFNTLPGIPWKLPLSLRNGPLGPESIRGSR